MAIKHRAEDYTYRVFWSDEDNAWIGVCDEFKSLSHISEDNQYEAFLGIVDLLRFVLDDMYENGEVPPVPFSKRTYSGHISLRMTPEQHRRIVMESAEQGVSINQLLVSRV